MKIYKGFIKGFLSPDHVFVFGSNTAGSHGGGAAYAALKTFGAVMGQAVGFQGQAYAIPTCTATIEKLSLSEIRSYVDAFLEAVRINPGKTFFLTPIGSGIAGFRAEEIAPLFAAGADLPNLVFPEAFADYLADGQTEVEVVTAFDGAQS